MGLQSLVWCWLALYVVTKLSGNIFATSFSGLIAAAVFNTVDGNHGLKGWQWLFIIEGCLTFGVALVGMLTLADGP